jgi:hypothetical protein
MDTQDPPLAIPDFLRNQENLAAEQAVQSKMTPTLEDKLAIMLWYLEEVRSKRRGADREAFESYLDDPEVAAWLDRMNKQGRIRNTRFITRR